MKTLTFVEFVVSNAKNWKPEEKAEAVRMLKEEPQRLKEIIINHIDEWGVKYCIKFGKMVIINNIDTTADEIISGWRDFLKEDLEKTS